MLSFDKIFGDWFADDAISLADLEAGARDHVKRLRQGNENGRFDQLIAATDARFAAYFGYRTDAATAASAGKGTTLSLAGAVQSMTVWLAGEGQDYIHYKLKNEADRLRFYPNGTSEYHQADYPEWPGLLKRFDEALAELGQSFEADFTTAYTTRRDALLAALTAQAGQKKKQADARVGSRAERDQLTRQLSRNARTLGLVFDDNPAEAATYFDPQYFNQHRPEENPTPPAARP